MSQIILCIVAAAEGLALLVSLFYLMVRFDQEIDKARREGEQQHRRRRRAADGQEAE